MQIVSLGDNLLEMSNPFCWANYKKNAISLSSAELALSAVSIKNNYGSFFFFFLLTAVLWLLYLAYALEQTGLSI